MWRFQENAHGLIADFSGNPPYRFLSVSPQKGPSPRIAGRSLFIVIMPSGTSP